MTDLNGNGGLDDQSQSAEQEDVSARPALSRRDALRGAAVLGGGLTIGGAASGALAQRRGKGKADKGEWITLFDGKTLDGWHSTPRLYGPLYPGGPNINRDPENVRQSKLYPAKWAVEDGAIVGQQDPDHPGFGGFLLTDRHFQDFEL